MKAITVQQPWANLVTDGTKYIVTRGRRTNYRGTLAVHAAKTDLHLRAHDGCPAACHGRALATASRNAHWHRLPLGVIVATGTLVDCAPIGGPTDFSTGLVEAPPAFADRAVVVHHPALGPFDESLVLDDPGKGPCDISDQLPYGDFSPGRWALLLDDVQPVEARCPACWGSYPYPTRKLCCLCHGKLRVAPVPARGGPGDLWDWEPDCGTVPTRPS